MSDELAGRVDTLEALVAHQDRTIEELSGQIAEQWKTIERLEKAMARFADRFVSIEEQVAADVPVTKPPHW